MADMERAVILDRFVSTLDAALTRRQAPDDAVTYRAAIDAALSYVIQHNATYIQYDSPMAYLPLIKALAALSDDAVYHLQESAGYIRTTLQPNRTWAVDAAVLLALARCDTDLDVCGDIANALRRAASSDLTRRAEARRRAAVEASVNDDTS